MPKSTVIVERMHAIYCSQTQMNTENSQIVHNKLEYKKKG